MLSVGTSAKVGRPWCMQLSSTSSPIPNVHMSASPEGAIIDNGRLIGVEQKQASPNPITDHPSWPVAEHERDW